MALAVLLGLFWDSHGRGEDRREAAAAGGRRPVEVQAGGAALRRVPGPDGAERAPRAGRERPGTAQPDGEARQARGSQDAGHGAPGPPQDAQEPRQAERTDALPSPRLVRQATRSKTRGRPSTFARPPDGRGRRSVRGCGAPSWAPPRLRSWSPPFRSPPQRTGTRRMKARASRRSSSRYRRPCPDGGFSWRGSASRETPTAVTLRAATGLDLRVRAFGGPEGRALRFWGSARLEEGERIDYSLPLKRPRPVLHPFVGGRDWGRRGPSLSRRRRSRTRFPSWRESSAT